MKTDSIKKLPERLLGFPRTAEWIVRNILLVGFFVLLTLVAGLGYLSWQGFRELDVEIAVIRQSEVNHERVISLVSETAGKIQSQAETVIANPDTRLVAFIARQKLKELGNEMTTRIQEGRITTLANAEEWKEF